MAKEQPFDSVDRNKSGSLDEDELVLLFRVLVDCSTLKSSIRHSQVGPVADDKRLNVQRAEGVKLLHLQAPQKKLGLLRGKEKRR